MQTKSEASLVVKPTPRHISCVLNEEYTTALKSKRFRWGSQKRKVYSFYDYEYKIEGIKDVKDKTICIQINTGNTTCCGIDELNFTTPALQNYVDDENWKELIALYIKKSVERDDGRVIFVGIPVENTNEHDSQYDFKFYNKLLKTLLQFGFKQVGTRYVNKNSNNKLAVLVGQMPE